MKASIILIAVAVIGTAALPNPFGSTSSSEQMAQQVVIALRKSSPESYAGLFPSLNEFCQIMDKEAAMYGEYLDEAKADFSNRYESEVIPALKASFASVIAEGVKKGIDWTTINYERVEYTTPKHSFETVPFTIVFTAGGKEYRVCLEKAFVISDLWKVSTTISLN